METIVKEKISNPNKLPFLQAQILQKIFLDLFENRKTAIEELAKITDRPKDSKILSDAIEALVEKGFLEGSLMNGFSISEGSLDLYTKIIKQNDYKHKKYFSNLLQFKEEVRYVRPLDRK